ncbi:unnamed protein product [Trichogramma brassicae]|uniref:Reverse transcriptase domain-containing protein n=1 Tax=Trichogramma brassicae TaxID=86971 RepID=A0A6H5IFZ9_9HYME|nr:unnamed protein product [Trichogramma brassicae]
MRDELVRCQKVVLSACMKVRHTVPTVAMQVLAGSPPWDLQCLIRRTKYKIRRGLALDDLDLITDDGSGVRSLLAKCNEEVMNKWQEAWDSSEKGKVTYELAPDVRILQKWTKWMNVRWLVCYILGKGVILKDVLYVPELTSNLFSVTSILSKGYKMDADYNHWKFIKNGDIEEDVFMRLPEGFNTPGKKKGETPWACIVVTDKRYDAVRLANISTSHFVCAHVSGPHGTFYVASLYCQFSDPIEPYMLMVTRACRAIGNKHLLVAADLNAISPLWNDHSNDIDYRGNVVEDTATLLDLAFANKSNELPTFRRGRKTIDATLISQSWEECVCEWTVLDDCVTSDHRAIRIVIRSEKRATTVREPRFCIRRANWAKYRRISSEANLIHIEAINKNEVDELVTTLTTTVCDAANRSIPKKKTRIKSVPWWNQVLTMKKRRSHRARKIWQREQDPARKQELGVAYRQCLREYTKGIHEAKRQSWWRFVVDTCNENPYGLVYKMFNNKMTPDKAISCIRTEEGHSMDWKRTMTGILDGLLGKLPEDSPERVMTYTYQPSGMEWSQRQVTRAVTSIKSGKAPGLDGIEAEMLKKLVNTPAMDFLTGIFNAGRKMGYFPDQWKNANLKILLKGEDKDETQTKSYRPICLLPIMSKVLEKLINWSLGQVLLEPVYASSRQYGYRINRSTEDAIVDVLDAIDEKEDKMVMALLFDVTGAFDNLLWSRTLGVLRRRQCPDDLYRIMESYLCNQRVTVTDAYEKLERPLIQGLSEGFHSWPFALESVRGRASGGN